MNSGDNNLFGQSDSEDPLQIYVMQIQVMQRVAMSEGASQRLKENWSTIDKWLGLDGSEMGQTDLARVAKAMKAYFAIGIAPSNKLQPVFDELSREYKSEGYDFKPDTPPVSVLNSFDGILATDEEIKVKRADEDNEGSPISANAMDKVNVQNEKLEGATEIGVKRDLKFGKVLKIFIAGTVTWVAATKTYYAIIYGEFGQFFVEQRNGYFDFLSFFPPLVAILGFILFRWAFGEPFVTWLINNKPTVGSTVFFLLISIAVINASTAADMAEQAYDMAYEANSSASEAASEASSAKSSASEAASEASLANLYCSNR